MPDRATQHLWAWEQRKKKIVFLARQAWPDLGGVEQHLLNVSDQLKKKYQITIICQQTSVEQPLAEKHNGVQYLRIPIHSGNSLKKQVWRWISIHFDVLQQADLIHVHDVFFWLYPFLWRLLLKPLFITFHGYEGDTPTWRQRVAHQLADFLSDRNICVGNFHQKWYQVEPDQLTFGAVEEMENAPHTKLQRGLFVGRLAPDTGILAYLDALTALPAPQRPAMNIFGDGPLRGQVEALIKTRHLPAQYLGAKQLSITDFSRYQFACVSGYLSILTAMAAGVPVVSTYQTEIKRDYLTRTPFAKWITIAENQQVLIEAFQNRPQLPAEATVWAKQQTWQKLANQYQRSWYG